jgi:hypothetical protein
MDRQFIYPGAVALAENALLGFKDAMINDGMIAEAILSSATSCYGLTATALASGVVSGSAFAVQIGRGALFSYQETDPNAYGVLGTDTATSILKAGINLTSTNLGITNAAPATTGFSQNFLISAAFQESDGTPTVLPYYNASNPSAPLSGAANSGATQNMTRTQRVVFQVTGGTAAATGSQTTPATPSGYVPLYVVTVNNGDTATVSGQIALAPGNPSFRNLAQVGKRNYQAWSTAGTYYWTCPAGVTQIKVIVSGGGGAGGPVGGTGAGASGGGAGGTSIATPTVVPGTTYTIVVGAGGASTTTGNGGNGGTSTAFGISATGGAGGQQGNGTNNSAGGAPGNGTGSSADNFSGGYGQDGQGTSSGGFGGDGGAGFWGGGGRGSDDAIGPSTALCPASGGGGAYGTTAIAGGAGAPGKVVIEY